MLSAQQVGRGARWLFALVIFMYLWREGGYWRYVSAGGILLMTILLSMMAFAHRHHKGN
jgi:hypothetical protein